MNINERLMQEFNLTKEHTDNVVSLLDETEKLILSNT